MTKISRVVIISGTPCVGKTSVARLLASRLNVTWIDLGELVKRENLVLEVDKGRGTLVADLVKVSRRLKEMLALAEGDVVVDGHFAVNVVSPSTVTKVFVLRRNPVELKRLMKNRGWSEKKVSENLACEVLDVCLYDAVKACGEKKVCEIDVSERRAEAVVDEILQVLGGKRPCRRGVVDWLGLLEREGRLREFLGDY